MSTNMLACSNSNKQFAIRNQTSGLVLDASENIVKIQHFTGFASQLWSLESAGPTTFYIINKCNGRVLDVQNGAFSGNNVTTAEKHGSENQRWYVNSDETIVNVNGDLALDIYDGQYSPGNRVIAFPKHGGPNQKFHFQFECAKTKTAV